MIKELYQKYFQKSFSFAFPLLQIKRKSLFRPSMTFMRLKGVYRQEDLKLIVQYKNEVDNPAWSRFQTQTLLPHPLLENCVESLDKLHMLYIFDLSSLEDDLRRLHKGQYSKLSVDSKKKLAAYYGIESPEWAYIESFLYPERYYEHYSKVLGIQEKVLREAVELCPSWDPVKETLIVELPDNFVELVTNQ